MVRKVVGLVLILLFICSYPVFGNLKAEWDSYLGWTPASSNDLWNTGFIASGDWSLGSNLAFFLKDELTISEAEQRWQGTLDRCYLQYEQGPLRLNLGQQGVTWGIGWFFRPTDIITPLSPLQEEENRPGRDLAALRWSTSPLTALDFIAGDQIYAARSEWRINATNLRLLGIYQPGYINTIGYDFQGGLAGFYGEGVYRWADDGAPSAGEYSGIIGWQKVLSSGNQLYLEFFRNNLCKSGPQLTELLQWNKNHELLFVDQDYLAAGLQIQWDQLTSVSITGISDLDNSNAILETIADWQLTNNLELRATLMFATKATGTGFGTFSPAAKEGVLLEVKYFF